jgi:alpha-glucosidase
MQWDGGPHAGFSPPDAATTWLPLAEDYAQVNVAQQLADPHSLLNLYRRLLAYRKESPALKWGKHEAMEQVPEGCYAFWRQAGANRLLVALNFGDAEHSLSLPARGEIVLSSHLDREGATSRGELKLRAHEGLIVEMPAG